MNLSFASGWRSFWHTMTSYDRHASHDSPYRTGSHVALSQDRHSPLTSVAATALESRHDLAYAHDGIEENAGFVNGTNRPMSAQSPVYKPGMRATLQRVSSDQSAPDIQMQNFNDGMPPAPPVEHSWKRIDRWAEDTYAELYDNLSGPCTQNDINELEHELDCTLPLDVRQSLQIHDGQERGGLPTGIIFGMMLLDCEEIVQEWANWQKVGQQYLSPPSSKRNSVVQLNGASSPTLSTATLPQALPKAFGGSSAASSSSAPPPPPPQSSSPSNGAWRSDLMARQTSHPPNTVQQAYTHSSWIPLARDWGGNCLAVDLAPGPAGKWGQVIIMGRDYDCKFVVSRSWAHFLAAVADDFGAGDFALEDGEGVEGRGNGGKVYVNEDTGELRFREFWDRQPGVDVPYLEVLRWRCERKHGRRPPIRRPMSMSSAHRDSNGSSNSVNGRSGLKVNSNAAGSGSGSGNGGPPSRSFDSANNSPYGSPTSTSSEQVFTSRDFAAGGEQRGRSPNRFSGGPSSSGQGKAPHVSSPLAQHHTSAPLDRVAEEPHTSSTAAAPSSRPGSGSAPQKLALRTDIIAAKDKDNLVSVDSARASGEFKRASSGGVPPLGERSAASENEQAGAGASANNSNGNAISDASADSNVVAGANANGSAMANKGQLGADGLLATPVVGVPPKRFGENEPPLGGAVSGPNGADEEEGEMKTVAI